MKMNIKKVPLFEVKSQCDQILNYSPNYLSNSDTLALLLYNFSQILKKHTSDNFHKSLQTSIDCINRDFSYTTSILQLKENTPDSFILAPVASDSHLFSCIISKVGENYEAVLVNKGKADMHYTYEKYVIPPESDKIQSIVDIIKRFRNSGIALPKIYDTFQKNSIKSEKLQFISSKSQKENNCYFKELEAGLKYAYTFLNPSSPNYNIQNTKDTITPKWPISTEKMHLLYLEKIKEEYPELQEYVDNLSKTYSLNKRFRDALKKEPDILKKADIFKEIFLNGDTPSPENISMALKKVDMQTFISNYMFFTTFCDKYKLTEHRMAINNLRKYSITRNEKYLDFSDSINELLPFAGKQLNIQYANHFYSLYLSSSDDEKNNFENDFKNVENSIKLFPENLNLYYIRGKLYSSINKLDEAINDFSKTIDGATTNPLCFFKRGMAYFNKDNFESAINDFSSAIELTNSYGLAWFYRGVCRLAKPTYIKEDYDNAFIDFKNALKYSPDNNNITNSILFVLNDPSVKKYMSEMDKALLDSEVTPVNNELTISFYYVASFKYILENNIPSAINYLNKLSKISPNDSLVDTLKNELFKRPSARIRLQKIRESEKENQKGPEISGNFDLN